MTTTESNDKPEVLRTQIQRYTLPVTDDWQRLDINGDILYVSTRGEDYIEMWLLAYGSNALQERWFKIYATGTQVPFGLQHIGSAVTPSGRFVWHLFEDIQRRRDLRVANG